ncbi:MAG: addiction module protein [Hahellaceae bacterium]|nr:addiction module protein [Hahellaceae bacterium]MCP5211703.1 addiction module protein [Hahellaceae bacterium]
MSIKQVLESTKHLNSSERAMLAHCLISSLDTIQDEHVEEAWGKLAEQRFNQLETGEIQGVSWGELKKDIRGE